MQAEVWTAVHYGPLAQDFSRMRVQAIGSVLSDARHLAALVSSSTALPEL